MRAGGSPARAALVLSLLLYSPGSHGGHIKWPPARAELATNLIPGPPGPGIRRARRGNVTCHRFILVGFIWENAALHGIRILLQYADQRCFRKCGEKSQTSEQTGFLTTKPQFSRGSNYQCAHGLGVFHRTSENQTNSVQPNRPFSTK